MLHYVYFLFITYSHHLLPLIHSSLAYRLARRLFVYASPTRHMFTYTPLFVASSPMHSLPTCLHIAYSSLPHLRLTFPFYVISSFICYMFLTCMSHVHCLHITYALFVRLCVTYSHTHRTCCSLFDALPNSLLNSKMSLR